MTRRSNPEQHKKSPSRETGNSGKNRARNRNWEKKAGSALFIALKQEREGKSLELSISSCAIRSKIWPGVYRGGALNELQ